MTTVHVYLALDPEDQVTRKPRVLMSTREFSPDDLPRGRRGHGRAWEIREADLDQATWDDLLTARLTPDEQDQLHQRLWTSSGATPFPEESA